MLRAVEFVVTAGARAYFVLQFAADIAVCLVEEADQTIDLISGLLAEPADGLEGSSELRELDSKLTSGLLWAS